MNKRFKKNASPKNEVAAVHYYEDADEVDDETLEQIYSDHSTYELTVFEPEGTPGRKMRVRVQLRHPLSSRTFTGILDTGCNKSTVAKEVVSWYNPQEGNSYTKSDGTTERTLGKITLPFKLEEFQTRKVTQEFQIVDQLIYPVILGTDFLETQGIILDFKNKELHWDGERIPMEEARREPRKIVLFAEMNEDGTETVSTTQGNPVNLDAFVPKDCLTLEQQQRLKQALQRIKVVFTQSIGKLKMKPYVFPVKPGAQPWVQAPYQIPQKLREPAKKEIERLVQLDVLEPDKDSPWATPAFVIPKKDGSIRLIADFRGLNRNLWRSYYPLPRIQDMLRELPKPVFITTLDLVMGYYSRELALESRPYTAIVLPWGKYRYRRLPMGISTAPDELHAIMTNLLGDLEYVRIYLDDVLILSASFDEHLVHLETVLQRLLEAGVVVHPQKSKFCVKKANYLGYTISSEGKEPMFKKVEAIQKLRRPRNIRDLRRFIGMVNYYKDMWRGRSELLAPLTRLTSHKRPFRWTEVEQTAFDAIKTAVSKATLLVYPDFNKPFDIYTDASNHQLGGVLMQEGRPLAFWSHKCDNTQQNYATNKKELLSIREMLREFRSIVWGRKVRVFTDHRNSTFQKFSNVTMLRWRLEIEEFGPELIYVEGKDNVVADALSRLPFQQTEVNAMQDAPLFSLSVKEMLEAQQKATLQVKQNWTKAGISGYELIVTKDTRRIVVPDNHRTPVMKTYHEWLVHPGITIMTQSIKTAFYWQGMDREIRRFVERCQTCARSKTRTVEYGEIPEKTVEVRPWNEIAVDSIGPMGKGKWRFHKRMEELRLQRSKSPALATSEGSTVDPGGPEERAPEQRSPEQLQLENQRAPLETSNSDQYSLPESPVQQTQGAQPASLTRTAPSVESPEDESNKTSPSFELLAVAPPPQARGTSIATTSLRIRPHG